MSKIIVADPTSAVKKLSGTSFVPSGKAPVSAPLCYHTDMQFHYLGEGCAVVCPELFDHYTHYFKDTGVEIICGSTLLGSTYPDDIAYNVARVSQKVALHRADKTDPMIVEGLKKMGVTLINLSQGYTKCSVAPVAENAFITSDRGIYAVALEHKMDVLLISEGNVELVPYPYGFIGGCTGLLSRNEMYFEGGLDTHPDGEKIGKFLEKYGVTTIEEKGKNLRDIGSVICIK